MVTPITKENYETLVKKSTKPVVIEVYATWCGPCQQVAPIFEELSKELNDKYTFVKLNVDDDRDIAVEYGVSSVPTFVFIKDGQVNKETGYMDKEDLHGKIKQHLD